MKEIIPFCMKGLLAMKSKNKRKLEILAIVLTILFSLFTVSGCSGVSASENIEIAESSAVPD